MVRARAEGRSQDRPVAGQRAGPVRGRAVRAPVGRLVGRTRELRAIRQLVSGARLVTLTGPGGVGKSRLAQCLADELSDVFPDGSHFVDLAELQNPHPWVPFDDVEAIAQTVAASLTVWDRPSTPTLTMLSEYLAHRRTLLVLDNCEHLLPACTVLVDRLLSACPELRILAISREPVGIFGEITYVVPPLAVPDSEALPTSQLSRYASVQLFVDRAEAAMPDFRLTDRNQAAVAEICRRLDGLPLAIELAAVWVRVLSPEQIVERLTDRFALLTRGSPAGPDRQRTMRACLDWSFGLCSAEEQRLWARLSVFAGSFELDAVQGVCADDRTAPDLISSLASLVERSVVVRDDSDSAARYRMLETIRAYGEDKLRDYGEHELLHQRHRDWYVELVRRAHDEWLTGRQVYWLGRLDRERAALRSAAEFSLGQQDGAEAILRIAVTVPALYWSARGLFGAVRLWLDRALSNVGSPTPLRARALLLDGLLTMLQGDLPAGSRLLDEADQIARSCDAATQTGYATFVRGVRHAMQGELTTALALLEQASMMLSTAGDSEQEAALAALFALGTVAVLDDDLESAAAAFKEMLEMTEPRGEMLYRSRATWGLGLASWREGDPAQGAALITDSLAHIRDAGLHDQFGIAACLEVLAWTAAEQSDLRRAAALFGAADTLWNQIGTPLAVLTPLAHVRRAYAEQARAQLGASAYDNAVRRGGRLSTQDRLAYALRERTQLPPVSSELTPLTPRERQVTELVAQGLTNKQIAAQLVISRRTADSHVEHILMKLGLTSRVQIAARYARRDADQPTDKGDRPL
jgi:predicted ATPase/DNA-binding CsgD family transcriptional regulator